MKKYNVKNILFLSFFLFFSLFFNNNLVFGTGNEKESSVENKLELNDENKYGEGIDIDTINSNINLDELLNNNDSKNNTMLDIIKDRTEKLEEKIGLNQTSNTEKEKEKIDDKIKENEIEKNVLEELMSILDERTNIITEDILSREERLKEITEQLLIEKESAQKNENSLSILERERDRLLSELNVQNQDILSLETEKKITQEKIALLNNDITELNIYKKRYQEKIISEKKENKKILIMQLSFYISMLLIYLLLNIHYRKQKLEYKQNKLYKQLNRLVIIEILSGIIFVLFTITYVVIINPGIGIIFVILGGSILLSIKGIISSFLTSFQVISSYKLGDKIIIDNLTGEIKSINLLTTTINILDDKRYFETNKDVRIPNSYFSEKEVTKINSQGNHNIENFELKINFKKINLDFPNLIKEIDNIFTKYNIPIIDNINKKRYYLTIKGINTIEYDLIFQYYNNEKLNNIQNDIIVLIYNNINENYCKDNGEDNK